MLVIIPWNAHTHHEVKMSFCHLTEETGSARIDVICPRIRGHGVFMPCSVPLVFLATGMACYKVSVVVHLLSRVWLSATLWTAVYQASLPSTISWSLLKFVSNESVMLPNHLILCHPLFCLQFFPASGSFPMSQLFPSGGQCIEASASATVLPMRIQGWFSLGLTDLIFLLSKGLSRVFSSITIWKHQFFGTQMILIDL